MLKERLLDVFTMIEGEYEEFWDTCCDHGNLGIHVFKNLDIKKVHLVDCVPGIIEKLKTKLARLKLSTHIELHNCVAQNINLSHKKSLVSICGVGGETAIEIIEGLSKKQNILLHDFIICAHHHIPQLRESLKSFGLKMKNQKLSFENNRAYEVLLVGAGGDQEVDLVGHSLFNLKDKRHRDYLERLVSHYEKKVLSDKSALHILDLYKSIQGLRH
jgi:tRNA (adenine22-N1)-methyltransferase